MQQMGRLEVRPSLLRRCTNLSFSEELLKEILAEIEIDGIGKMTSIASSSG